MADLYGETNEADNSGTGLVMESGMVDISFVVVAIFRV